MPHPVLCFPPLSIEEFKIIMRAGPKQMGALQDVIKKMTDPDEMKLMLRNSRCMFVCMCMFISIACPCARGSHVTGR